MGPIHLQEATLIREVQQAATHEGKDAEAIVAEAVRRHLAHYRIDDEDDSDDGQEVILGRNVLNLLLLLLEGPQQQSTILERRPRRF